MLVKTGFAQLLRQIKQFVCGELPLPLACSNHSGGILVKSAKLVRSLYFLAGVVAMLAGAIGLVLPLLPTTPFVLLAAACFARSSERVYQAMLRHRLLGPILYDWRTHGAMKRQTKRWAGLVMVLSFGASIWVVPSLWHRGMLLVIAAILGYFIWRVPVRAESGQPSRPGGCQDTTVMPDQVNGSALGTDQTPR